MAARHHAAVIFDVDGPLLDLTPAEEDAYFVPFAEFYGLTGLSRDWDRYRVRNDLEIYREIFETHLGRAPSEAEIQRILARYLDALHEAYAAGRADVVATPGAARLLDRLSRHAGVALGSATANFQSVAQLRLERVGLWDHVAPFPGAAERGGPKRQVLASVIAELGLPRDRVVFLGDNLNDLDAGLACGVHFIGFHWTVERRERLRAAGAEIVTGEHEESYQLIREMLGLPADPV